MTLSGDWYTQIGSKMTLTSDEDGGLSGKYYSAVGNAENFFILTGRYDTGTPRASQAGISVGWVVTFHNERRNAHSTTAWSGQHFAEGGGGVERIVTHWHLTRSTTPGDFWSSTFIGSSTFTRNLPGAAEIARSRALAVELPYPEDLVETTQ